MGDNVNVRLWGPNQPLAGGGDNPVVMAYHGGQDCAVGWWSLEACGRTLRRRRAWKPTCGGKRGGQRSVWDDKTEIRDTDTGGCQCMVVTAGPAG